MNREEILDLLLRDRSNDSLVERPELYSIEEDIRQWMYDTRDYWNRRIPELMENERQSWREILRNEPEYAKHCVRFHTEEHFRRRAYRQYRLARGRERGECHWTLAHFWRKLLTARPEYASRCPWESFRGDMIWMSLQDKAFCKALAIPKQEIARKMPLKLMSVVDWKELLEIVPKLRPDYDRLVATGYKFDAYCY